MSLTAGTKLGRYEIRSQLGGASLYGLYSCYLSLMGRYDEAIAAAKRGVDLDPLLMIAYWDLALVNYQARRYDQALK